MNKMDLVNIVASKTGFTKKNSEAVVSATLEAITEALAGGENVRLMGFGTFETKNRAARMRRNPRTKEPVSIPASRTPAFKPGSALKADINAG